MRGEKNRSFLPMSLVLALLVASAIAVLSTQEVRTQSVRATNWSDPATWPNKKVPAAGDKVIIDGLLKIGPGAPVRIAAPARGDAVVTQADSSGVRVESLAPFVEVSQSVVQVVV